MRYAKKKKANADLSKGDGDKAVAAMELLQETADESLRKLSPKLSEYLDLIPAFREEFWPGKGPQPRVAISEKLKDAFEKGESKVVLEMLVKWLYKIRCNLVHGDKGYDDLQQQTLLVQSSQLLEVLLGEMIVSFGRQYPEPCQS